MLPVDVPRSRPPSPRIVEQLEVSDVMRDQGLSVGSRAKEEVIIACTCQTNQTGCCGCMAGPHKQTAQCLIDVVIQ